VAPGAASWDASGVVREGEGGPAFSRFDRERGWTEYELERERERERAGLSERERQRIGW
jgi:hypothetical protein